MNACGGGDALAAAVALCNDDADRNPPADFPPALEGVLLGDALQYLAGVSKMYGELGSGAMFSFVGTALVRALARCEEAATGAGAASV